MRRTLVHAIFALVLAAPLSAQKSAFSSSHIAAAEELLEALEVQQGMRDGVQSSLEMQTQANPMMAPFRETMQAFYDKYITWSEVKGRLAKVYASQFSEAELRTITAFHRTPTGAKLVKRQAALSSAVIEVMQQLVESHSGELRAMMQARAEELAKDSTTKP